MNPFTLCDGALNAEQVPVEAIAEAYGTPCYIYSRAALEAALDEYQQALADALPELRATLETRYHPDLR